MLRFTLIAALFCTSVCAFAQAQPQNEPSLAERAAAMRKKATPTPTDIPEATATPDTSAAAAPADKKTTAATPVASPAAASDTEAQTPQETVCGFRDASLGLTVKCPDGWSALDANELASRKAAQHPLLHERSESQPHDIAGIALRDAVGGSIFLSVVKLRPSDPLPPNLRGEIQHVYTAERPKIIVSEEPTLLNDATHHFAAFRAAYDANGVHVESVQAMVFKGYFVQFLVSAGSQEHVTKALQDLKTHIAWSTASAK